MKKLLHFTICSILILTAVSCKKDKKTTPEETASIAGKWHPVSQTIQDYVNGQSSGPNTRSDFGTADYMEFKSDGTGYSSIGNNKSNFTYSISGKKIILPNPVGVLADGESEIKEITATKLVIVFDNTTTDGGVTYRATERTEFSRIP